jgi:N-acetylneuraminate synthase
MNDDEANLACIETLRTRYGVPIGWSGHERGVPLSTWAVARWRACIVERHLTLDRAMRGSDHAASLEPKGLALLIRDIRIGEGADGHGRKEVSAREQAQIERLRRVR